MYKCWIGINILLCCYIYMYRLSREEMKIRLRKGSGMIPMWFMRNSGPSPHKTTVKMERLCTGLHTMDNRTLPKCWLARVQVCYWMLRGPSLFNWNLHIVWYVILEYCDVKFGSQLFGADLNSINHIPFFTFPPPCWVYIFFCCGVFSCYWNLIFFFTIPFMIKT